MCLTQPEIRCQICDVFVARAGCIIRYKKRAEAYKARYPEAKDVLLVIEAADSSLRKDQQLKLPVYAQAGISDYWIADLEKEVILVHRQPEGNVYQAVTTYRAEEAISPLAAPDFSITAFQAFN